MIPVPVEVVKNINTAVGRRFNKGYKLYWKYEYKQKMMIKKYINEEV